MEARYRPLPGGGYVLEEGSLLAAEYGGDGRMPADAKVEARPDMTRAKATADRIKAALVTKRPVRPFRRYITKQTP